MEALAAISLTGNILQFIEVTSRLISSTHQVSHHGSKTEYLELETIAQELRSRAQTITLQHDPSENGEGIKTDDATLEGISAQCIDITNQLLSVLDSVRLKEGSNKLRSFYQALMSEWKADEIEALQKRVDRIGQTLNNHLITSQQFQISQKLNQLAAENYRLEASRTEDIKDLKIQLRMAFHGLRNELQQQESRDTPSSVLLRVAERGIQYSAEQVILEKLRFDTIDDRYEGISATHHNTFSWIFGAQTNGTETFPSFVQWLISADDFYWISGKPGSGKSTLMKYLCTHEETKRRLQEWAQNDRLVIASFFFWNAGKKSLQKSQQGLLRSMIYQILRQSPEIIRQIYPGVKQSQRTVNFGESGLEEGDLPTSVSGLLSTLRKACELLTLSQARLCFFIDGLDEFEGHPSNIIELIDTIRSMPNVKICASSRPWNEFEQSFGRNGSRKLYMQELTLDDIRNYVCDTLENDENYQSLEEKDECGTDLINEIIQAAQGVFLWVVLVVRSFQEGLTNGDRIVDLQRRLRHLPRDLNEYFEKILLSDVAELYRPQSARMFMTSLKASDRLPIMAYWFMDQEDSNYVFDLEIQPLSLQKLNKRLTQTRKRLNACCKGLLEVHFLSKANDEDVGPSSILFNWKVDFLHRTVKDFLITPETQAFLSSWNQQQKFDADTIICGALLSQIKTAPRDYEYFELQSGIPELLSMFFRHAKILNGNSDDKSNPLTLLLDHLDATLHDHDKNIGQGLYLNVLYTILSQDGFAEKCGLRGDQVTFLHVCTRYGLSRFIDQKLGSSDHMGGGTTKAILPSLLRLALEGNDHVMVDLLLRKGANPNAPVGGETSWRQFLRNLDQKRGTSVGPKPTELSTFLCVRHLLEYGAQTGAGGAYSTLQQALVPEHMALIEHFFTRKSEDTYLAAKANLKINNDPTTGLSEAFMYDRDEVRTALATAQAWLGLLYKSQGKLGEAEKMYQRALEGYKKALGPEIVASYVPALNTAYNLGLLFAGQGHVDRARAMYSRALIGYEKVFGVDHQECEDVQKKLNLLRDSAGGSNTSANATNHCSQITSQETSNSNMQRKSRVSNRRRILQKLSWR